MGELRISDRSNDVVLYFETPEPRINAYALASTLVALADAAKAAGRSLNSAVDIEIVVEALGPGSFRAKISAIMRESGLFLKQQVVIPLLVGVLSTYVYENTLAKKEPIQIQVDGDEVIIVHGQDRVIVPRKVHDATRLVAENPTFTRSMDRMLDGVVRDETVSGFGIAQEVTGPPPAVVLPRELLAIRDAGQDPGAKTRVIEEHCDLYIVKAIMERSNRKWGFRWHGVSISAPIKDSKFYDEFAKHHITIAPGDEFQVRLAIHQERDDVSGVYTNTGYEVVEVYRHISRPKPGDLPLRPEEPTGNPEPSGGAEDESGKNELGDDWHPRFPARILNR